MAPLALEGVRLDSVVVDPCVRFMQGGDKFVLQVFELFMHNNIVHKLCNQCYLILYDGIKITYIPVSITADGDMFIIIDQIPC